MRSCW